jgi:hypothetical protein
VKVSRTRTTCNAISDDLYAVTSPPVTGDLTLGEDLLQN